MPSKNFLQIIRKACKSDGWSQSRTAGGHIKLTHPNAATPVFCSGTTSDIRAAENLKGDLRRALKAGEARQEPAAPDTPPTPPDAAPPAPETAPAPVQEPGETERLRAELETERHRRGIAEQHASHLGEALSCERKKVGALEQELKPLRELGALIRAVARRDFFSEVTPAAAPAPAPTPAPAPAPAQASKPINPMNAGRLIFAHRQITGDSQKDAGLRIGVSNVTVSSWERGETKPREGNMAAIRAYLSTSVAPHQPSNNAANHVGHG